MAARRLCGEILILISTISHARRQALVRTVENSRACVDLLQSTFRTRSRLDSRRPKGQRGACIASRHFSDGRPPDHHKGTAPDFLFYALSRSSERPAPGDDIRLSSDVSRGGGGSRGTCGRSRDDERAGPCSGPRLRSVTRPT